MKIYKLEFSDKKHKHINEADILDFFPNVYEARKRALSVIENPTKGETFCRISIVNPFQQIK